MSNHKVTLKTVCAEMEQKFNDKCFEYSLGPFRGNQIAICNISELEFTLYVSSTDDETRIEISCKADDAEECRSTVVEFLEDTMLKKCHVLKYTNTSIEDILQTCFVMSNSKSSIEKDFLIAKMLHTNVELA